MNRSSSSFGLAFLFVVAFVGGIPRANATNSDCGKPWTECRALDFSTTIFESHYRVIGGHLRRILAPKSISVKLRAGYIAEADHSRVPFKGNILYYQGLADSIRNHAPFFTRLSAEGYRVIAFDYPGQGGSEGFMGDTRILDIEKMGEAAWRRYAVDADGHAITSDSQVQRTVIGWSTGGLAAYAAAKSGLVDRVVLIAPGIAPKNVYLITEGSLTSARYPTKKSDPHRDGISPRSPALVLKFACDLLHTAAAARGEVLNDPTCLDPMAGTSPSPIPAWDVPSKIPGLVLLSDEKDKYVDAEKTRPIIRAHTDFEIEQYAGALHEIDNERDAIRARAYADVLSFLGRTNRR